MLVPCKSISTVQAKRAFLSEKWLMPHPNYNIPMDFLWKTNEPMVFIRAYIICTINFSHSSVSTFPLKVSALVITKHLLVPQMISVLPPGLHKYSSTISPSTTFSWLTLKHKVSAKCHFIRKTLPGHPHHSLLYALI